VVLVCTNAWANDLLDTEDIKPARGQVIVTSPIATLPWRGLIHCDKGYIYARTLGTRILIGGGRNVDFKNEETTVQESNEKITDYLQEFIKDVLTDEQDFSVDYEWAGIMGMSESRAPIVKEVSGGLYCGIRLGGMGLALSAEVANQLSELVLEKYH
jgi:glycine/D-amino acid oxidase-like deaminating enzyme